jgi:hypothetical protein
VPKLIIFVMRVVVKKRPLGLLIQPTTPGERIIVRSPVNALPTSALILKNTFEKGVFCHIVGTTTS